VRQVTSNGVSLAIHEWPGGEPAIVAIHGLTSNHTAWYPIADVLGGSHRLIAYDLRGRGDSEKPAKGYSLAEHAADLLGLLDHFGLDRAVMMGHSLGGPTSGCTSHRTTRIAWPSSSCSTEGSTCAPRCSTRSLPP
jgi:pimeloyl-ACP methyl ester carboxylesterase